MAQRPLKALYEQFLRCHSIWLNAAATHDLKGNLTEYEINGKEYTVEYDLDNRIVKVEVDNDDVEYRYDAFGRRVIRKEGSTNTSLIWWGNSECAEHKHQAGTTVIQNDIMEHPSRLNSVIARAVDGSKFKLEWYHKNYLDHVYAVSDDTGDILEHYRYTAFGEVTIYNENGNQVATTQIDNHILWNTRRRDELTGYYMYKFRHYSPELGRWPSRDPIEESGGVNLYAFVGNDSLNYLDFLGLDGTTLDIPDFSHAHDQIPDNLNEVMAEKLAQALKDLDILDANETADQNYRYIEKALCKNPKFPRLEKRTEKLRAKDPYGDKESPVDYTQTKRYQLFQVKLGGKLTALNNFSLTMTAKAGAVGLPVTVGYKEKMTYTYKGKASQYLNVAPKKLEYRCYCFNRQLTPPRQYETDEWLSKNIGYKQWTSYDWDELRIFHTEKDAGFYVNLALGGLGKASVKYH